MTAQVFAMFDHPARERRELQTMKVALCELHQRRIRCETELGEVTVQIGELAARIKTIEAGDAA